MKANITRRQLLVGVGALAIAHGVQAAPYQTPAQDVEIWRGEWRDAKRDRNVPVKIYYPKTGGPYPVIIFSHGLGGSREGYEYLGQYWAAHGYASVHLQHIGSDDAVWKGGGGMQAMRNTRTPKNALERPRDVSFAIDQITSLNKTALWPPRGKVDLQKIGVAGHSFGANTTLLSSGMKLGVAGMSFADPRLKAAIAMSAPKPALKNYDSIYGNVHLPIFHLTGTKDESPLDTPGASAIDRRLPFDHIRGADQYLVTFTDGDHMVFSGQRRGNQPLPTDARNHTLIQQATTAFWDTYLRGDEKAKTWLRGDFKQELGAAGVFEMKEKA